MEDSLSTIMMADKMTTMFGDVTGLQQHHNPYKNIPHLFDRIEGFSLNALSFGNTATYKKTIGRGPINPPALPSYTYLGGDINLRVRPRVKSTSLARLSVIKVSLLSFLL